MSYPFEKIVILYNPISTGSSKVNAERLMDNLKGKVPAELELVFTEYAGHGEKIAADYAASDAKVLLVSSSGDGGYHELINGALSQASKNVCTLVLPSGNANDHHHATTDEDRDEIDDLPSRIIKPKIIQIDAIKVEAQVDGKQWQRYAHSYAGIGLTAYIGKKLRQAELNPINEKFIVLKYLLRFQAVKAKLGDGRWHRYSNLLFSNVNKISKFISLGDDTKASDGKFEIYATRATSSLAIIGTILKGSIFWLKPEAQLDTTTFTTKHKAQIQFDGEVFTIDGQSPVTVSLAKGAIHTLA